MVNAKNKIPDFCPWGGGEVKTGRFAPAPSMDHTEHPWYVLDESVWAAYFEATNSKHNVQCT